MSLIPDDTYFDSMREIYALPVRKQAKWRGFLQDTNGVKHRVHFVNDELVFKHKSTWITVKPTSDEFTRTQAVKISAKEWSGVEGSLQPSRNMTVWSTKQRLGIIAASPTRSES